MIKSLELCGKAEPAVDLSRYEPLQPQVSDEELRRRSQSKEKGHTFAGVLAYLEKA